MTKRQEPIKTGVSTQVTTKRLDRANATEHAITQRKEAAISMGKAGWGLPADPRQRSAIMSLTAYYGLDWVMGDILVLGGTTLYITAQAYMKKLDESAQAKYDGKSYRWTKRPCTPDEIDALGYGEVPNARVWYVELLPPEGCGEMPITSAFGEADVGNCQLQNISKLKGDPRVLNRMALKRAQHECTRDVVGFRLPSPADFKEKMGMAMDEMLKSGVQVVLDDGLIGPDHGNTELLPKPAAPEPEPEKKEAKPSAKKAEPPQPEQPQENEPPTEPLQESQAEPQEESTEDQSGDKPQPDPNDGLPWG